MHQTLIKPLCSDIKKFVLDVLFPVTCLSCGKEGSFVCSECKNLLTPLERQRCIICQKPAPSGLTHPHCSNSFAPEGSISFFDYHDPKISKILIKGKYSFLPGVYKQLGLWAAQKLQYDFPNILSKPYTLTSVPLHSFRKRWRGFNQSEILAKEIAEQLSLPYLSVLKRARPTQTQKDLQKEERQKNMTGAFCIPAKIQSGSGLVTKQNFILVDDITTTGATLLAAVKELKKAGASQVLCLTVACD